LNEITEVPKNEQNIKKEEKANSIEIRSEEVQEIMGTPPRWIVRWGITIILLVVLVLFAGSYFYKYPDLIVARVVVVSENPPVSVVARSAGKLIKIFVTDKQTVNANTLLGIIENPANYEDVYELISLLESVQPYFSQPELLNNLAFNKEYSLGQITHIIHHL
jgi:biotin carboxyl carrier protein